MNITVGQQVFFGRSNGERTLGTVLKINTGSVKVRQDESRGTMKAHPVGTVWRVAPSLITPITGSPITKSAQKRDEAVILRDLRNAYGSLSPECLTCDGEVRGVAVTRRRDAINARIRTLTAELGRPLTTAERYDFESY